MTAGMAVDVEETDPLVVTQGVGGDAGPADDLGYGVGLLADVNCGHDSKLRLRARSKSRIPHDSWPYGGEGPT
jgi:hypothetical protein